MKNAFLLLLFSRRANFSILLFCLISFSFSYPLTVGDKVIGSVGMVLFYYLLVGFAEEGSKHLSFLASSSDDSKTLSDGILYALFVAPWFWFFGKYFISFGMFSKMHKVFLQYSPLGFPAHFFLCLYIWCVEVWWVGISFALGVVFS